MNAVLPTPVSPISKIVNESFFHGVRVILELSTQGGKSGILRTTGGTGPGAGAGVGLDKGGAGVVSGLGCVTGAGRLGSGFNVGGVAAFDGVDVAPSCADSAGSEVVVSRLFMIPTKT